MKKILLFSALLVALFFNSCSKDDAPTPTIPVAKVFEKVTTNLPKIAFHQSVVFNNKIWVIGGVIESANGQEMYSNTIFSSPDGVTFTNHGNASFSPRGYHQVKVFNGKLWLIGGYYAIGGVQTVFNETWSSSDGINWIQETANLFSIYKHKVIVHNNKMYCIGGTDSNNNDAGVWETSDGTSWLYVGDVIGLRYDHSVAIFKNKIYVNAGISFFNSFDDCWSSSDGYVWNQESVLPLNNNFGLNREHEAIAKNDKLYLVGGLNNKVWETSNGIDWTSTLQIGNIDQSVVGHELVVFNDKIYVIGGVFDSDIYATEIYKSNF